MSKPGALIEPLTRREQEILVMLVAHCSNKEIASSQSLSVNSVKWYARQIYGKLGVENRRQVAARASLQLSHKTGTLIDQIFSLRNLGTATLRLGKLKQSSEYYSENEALAEKVNWMENEWVKYDLLTFILGMAGIAFEMGDTLTTAWLFGAVEAQFENFFKPLDPWDQAEFDWIVGQVRNQLDEATFASAWAAGRELTLEQAIDEARQVSL
jgi:DNA-binding CsgD family transcriptional regulator